MNTEKPKFWYLAENDEEAEIICSEEPPKMRFEGGKWSSRSGGISSEEELREKCKIQDWLCSICGRIVGANYSGMERMLKKKLCFTCNYWDKLAEKPLMSRAVIKGTHYTISDDLPSGHASVAGHGGRKFVIRFDDGREVTSRNLWHQGPIPKHFRDRLQDNATFIL